MAPRPGRVTSSYLCFTSDRLYPAASSSERISFNRINKKTGNRLKQQLVDVETGETVEKEDNGRGYEIGKGQYLQIEDEEIEKIPRATGRLTSLLGRRRDRPYR